MLQILSIGNSFSEDAQRYLHQIAAKQGVDLRCVNLYIGGCSLQQHCDNLHTNEPAYMWQENGAHTDIFVSITQALRQTQWDYVTVQQVSQLSPFFESYTPYLTELVQHIRTLVPKAKLLVHQTWPYEGGSHRLTAELGYQDPHDMLKDIAAAYQKAAAHISADGIIPSGEAMMHAIDSGLFPAYRDGFHANLGLGRYLLGLTWFMTITGQQEIHGDIELDEPADAAMRLLALQAAQKAAHLRVCTA